MTEEDGILLNELTNEYWDEFGQLIAKYLNKTPKHLRDEMKDLLSEHSSLYGSCYQKYLNK